MRTGVALGSNLGDRLATLRAARKAIVDLADAEPPILSSAIYETEPVNCEPGAERFLNAVLEFDYEGDPVNLLRKLTEIESVFGRPRDRARNVSRQIDLDLLYVGEMKIDTAEVELPHPRMHSRRFVLQPLADIRPDLVLPRQANTVRELLARLDDSGTVVQLTKDWQSR